MREYHNGAAILTDAYAAAVKVHGNTPYALLAALSKYNTGSLTAGFASGYVARYASAWGKPTLAIARGVTPAAATSDTQISLQQSADFSHARSAAVDVSTGAIRAAQPPSTPELDAKMADTQIELSQEDALPVVSGNPADFGRAGVQVELDEDEAVDMGVTPETGLSYAAAWDSNFDNENSVPSLPAERAERAEAKHGQ